MDFIEYATQVVLVFIPILPFLYSLMLVVADSLITAVQNWDD